MSRLYVYKVRNSPHQQFAADGDWRDVFRSPKKMLWVGSWATGHPSSRRIFDQDLRMGDLILAWQSNRSAAVGVCEVADFKNTERGKEVALLPVEEFVAPVRLHELKRTTHPELHAVHALTQGLVATLYPTTREEAWLLLEACGSKLASRFRA